jgi:hypothetical protein
MHNLITKCEKERVWNTSIYGQSFAKQRNEVIMVK